MAGQAIENSSVREKAEMGDPVAQFELAYEIYSDLLSEGLSVTDAQASKKLSEACEWARKSGEDNGHAEALNLYAICVQNGYGQRQDSIKALKILETAATIGSVGAKLTLSERYLTGDNLIDVNEKRAFDLVMSAATGDGKYEPDSYAQWKVAMLILDGKGTKQDAELAFQWVKRSSEAGNISAMISRAVMLATGQGVTENDEEARSWYEKVALSGDVNFAHGLRGLGHMIFIGEGGPPDTILGFGYLLMAQSANDENAKKLVDSYQDQLSNEEIDAAFTVAQQWADQNLAIDQDQ